MPMSCGADVLGAALFTFPGCATDDFSVRTPGNAHTPLLDCGSLRGSFLF